MPHAPTSLCLSLSLCQFCCCLNESRLRFFSLRCTASFVGLCTVDDPRCPHSVARANACHTHTCIVPRVHTPLPQMCPCLARRAAQTAFSLLSYLGAGLVPSCGCSGGLSGCRCSGVVTAVCQAASSSKHEPAQPTSAHCMEHNISCRCCRGQLDCCPAAVGARLCMGWCTLGVLMLAFSARTHLKKHLTRAVCMHMGRDPLCLWLACA